MFKTYVVTITPKHQSYAGSWASGEYTVFRAKIKKEEQE